MKDSVISKYQEYSQHIGNRKVMYRELQEKFSIVKVLYPGSYIDITPSLIFPKVTYVDNFKKAISFFREIDVLEAYIQEEKEYNVQGKIKFLGQDYWEDLAVEEVDCIISQYAGFVGQATKQYLKKGGILLCNDSHGDATLAQADESFELIGVIDATDQLQTEDKEDYFKRPRNQEVDLLKVRQTMKGPKYKKVAENYVFRKK